MAARALMRRWRMRLPAWFADYIDTTRVLSRRRLAELFPNGRTRVECFFGFPKSYVLYSPKYSAAPVSTGRWKKGSLSGEGPSRGPVRGHPLREERISRGSRQVSSRGPPHRALADLRCLFEFHLFEEQIGHQSPQP